MAGWQDAPIAAATVATSAPAWQAAPVAAGPTNQQKYDDALATVRRKEFPNMTDEQFSNYSKAALAPYSLNDEAQQGQTMGFGDEIAAGVGAFGNQVRQWTGGGGPGFGEAYGDLDKLEQARRDLGADKNGWLSTAANVVGGLSSFGPEKAALDATIDAGRAAAAGITAAPAAAPTVTAIKAPLWQQAAKGAVTAAPFGAVAGAGFTDGDLGDRAKGAVISAGEAAGLGFAAPYVVTPIAASVKRVADAMFRASTAAKAGLDPAVADFLQRSLDFSPEGAARMGEAGPEAMPVDSSIGARAQLDEAIQANAEAGAHASEQVNARVGRDAGALNDALDRHLGQPQSVEEMVRNTREASAPERSDAYTTAFSKPIDYSSTEGRMLENALANRVKQSDINAANSLLREKGAPPSQQIMATIADNGTVSYKTLPNVQQIDAITRAIGDRAKNLTGGAMGGATEGAASAMNLQRHLRSTLRVAVPEYGAALDTASDTIGRVKGLQFGQTALGDGVTRGEVGAFMEEASPAARTAVKQGVRSAWDERLAAVKRTVNDGDMNAREAIASLKQFSSRKVQDKLAMILNDPGAAEELQREFERASKSFELRAGVADNSRTYARLAQKEARTQFAEGGENPMQKLMEGSPLEAGKKLVQTVTGETAALKAERADGFQRQIAEALLLQGQQKDALMGTLKGLNRNSNAADKVGRALLSGGHNVGNVTKVVVPAERRRQAQRELSASP